MKRTALIAAILTVLTTAVFAAKFIPATGSSVTIEGTSTLHAWKMEGSTINGHIDVGDDYALAKVAVAIPVATIKSEHRKMDALMRDALKAKENPEVRYVMTSAALQESAGATFTLKTNGKLTIAGVTRDVAMTVAGRRASDGSYVLAGEAPIRMTDYGIKPPKAMMGTIRTGDDVKVTFRWVVAAAN